MKLELVILELLARREPELMREIVLRNEAELECGLQLGLAEVKSKLRGLEARGEVLALTNEDTGTQWGISSAGKARLWKSNWG